jgi:amino acid transporter
MVTVSFGSYATSTFAGENAAGIKVFAALIILVMTGVNIAGSKLVANAQTVIVYVALGILGAPRSRWPPSQRWTGRATG